ncbi:P0 [Barleria polerovirus 1]|uniref:P0 n=1 Tax=Barleria polerovirus 1 TaxID=2838079 RepID=A0A8E7PF36_9VIRU|nr:P0 [Barleria polerovirus 1]
MQLVALQSTGHLTLKDFPFDLPLRLRILVVVQIIYNLSALLFSLPSNDHRSNFLRSLLSALPLLIGGVSGLWDHNKPTRRLHRYIRHSLRAGVSFEPDHIVASLESGRVRMPSTMGLFLYRDNACVLAENIRRHSDLLFKDVGPSGDVGRTLRCMLNMLCKKTDDNHRVSRCPISADDSLAVGLHALGNALYDLSLCVELLHDSRHYRVIDILHRLLGEDGARDFWRLCGLPRTSLQTYQEARSLH